ncbi:MAG: type II secretion system protein [Candidatus Paceibacterota bacterium]|jgi:prepilin-type N-terminal cleavage/methylation domain-containing protein
MHNNKGFTLVEMLVVIAIIGLLATVVITSLQDAKDKAKNTKFAVETRELQKALQMYKLDHNETQPPCPPLYSPTNNHNPFACYDFFGFPWLDEALEPLIIGRYISKIPHFDVTHDTGLERWAYTAYLPNVYNHAGVEAVEYGCKTIHFANWIKGSLPGVILIGTSEDLPLSEGYVSCDSTEQECSWHTSNASFKVYCLPLDM